MKKQVHEDGIFCSDIRGIRMIKDGDELRLQVYLMDKYPSPVIPGTWHEELIWVDVPIISAPLADLEADSQGNPIPTLNDKYAISATKLRSRD